MTQKFELFPGVTLRTFADDRFKQGCLSLQIIRRQRAEEAAMNALIPTVLLRGCRSCPDLRSITNRLDELYGASVGTMVRRVGDDQATGLSCTFLDDRFAMDGDRILEPMLQFLGELLLDPLTEEGGFENGYEEAYFNKNQLIAVMTTAASSSVRYEATSITKTDIGTWELTITRYSPEWFTDDMEQQLILVELPRTVEPEDTVILVTVDME